MLFIKSAQIQKLLDLKKYAGEHEGSRAMINQLMEEYHTLINELIHKYPGSLNLSGTKYQDHRIFYVLNTLGAILRQKIIKLLYQERERQDRDEDNSERNSEVESFIKQKILSEYSDCQQKSKRKIKIPKRMLSFLSTSQKEQIESTESRSRFNRMFTYYRKDTADFNYNGSMVIDSHRSCIDDRPNSTLHDAVMSLKEIVQSKQKQSQTPVPKNHSD